mmetsp:Transcript_32418/g.96676  ORF Transcript_32418/g.96676 Transcript_32418/m.96676 type:complete len:338 (-) Transcript_32418:175-1188(-)
MPRFLLVLEDAGARVGASSHASAGVGVVLLLLRRRLLVAARAPQTQDGMLARCRDAVLRQELPVALLVALLRLLGLHGLQPVPPIPDGVVGPVRQPLRDQKPAVAQLRHARRDDCVLASAPAGAVWLLGARCSRRGRRGSRRGRRRRRVLLARGPGLRRGGRRQRRGRRTRLALGRCGGDGRRGVGGRGSRARRCSCRGVATSYPPPLRLRHRHVALQPIPPVADGVIRAPGYQLRDETPLEPLLLCVEKDQPVLFPRPLLPGDSWGAARRQRRLPFREADVPLLWRAAPLALVHLVLVVPGPLELRSSAADSAAASAAASAEPPDLALDGNVAQPL